MHSVTTKEYAVWSVLMNIIENMN